MDPILAGFLATLASDLLLALGRRVDDATQPGNPVQAAIANLGIETTDAEVIPALEAWTTSTAFTRCLTALASGEQEFSAEALVDNFIDAGSFYADTHTQELAIETLVAFGHALQEEVMGEGVAIHDRHERRRLELLSEKVDLVLQAQLAGQIPTQIGGWWQRFDAYEFDEGWLRQRRTRA